MQMHASGHYALFQNVHPAHEFSADFREAQIQRLFCFQPPP